VAVYSMKIKYSDKVKEKLGMHPQPSRVECHFCHKPVGRRGDAPSVTLKKADVDGEVMTHITCLRSYLLGQGSNIKKVGMD